MNLFFRTRRKLAITLSKRLLPKPFTILSDDCWGGQIYRQLKLPYLTPTVGLFIKHQHYLDYICNFDSLHTEELCFIGTAETYPVATLGGVEIHFMHYKNEAHAKEAYWRRFSRIQHDKILVKIDFGNSIYSVADIQRWNALRLSNSLALYSPSTKMPAEGIHNGVVVGDWQIDGAVMFDITRKHFDLFAWINKGIVRNGFVYRALNFLLLDPTVAP